MLSHMFYYSNLGHPIISFVRTVNIEWAKNIFSARMYPCLQAICKWNSQSMLKLSIWLIKGKYHYLIDLYYSQNFSLHCRKIAALNTHES